MGISHKSPPGKELEEEELEKIRKELNVKRKRKNSLLWQTIQGLAVSCYSRLLLNPA
jgi:hypothetical protein